MGTASRGLQRPGRGAVLLTAAGCAAMAVGALVYLVDRDPSRTVLLPAVAALWSFSSYGAPLHFGLVTEVTVGGTLWRAAVWTK